MTPASSEVGRKLGAVNGLRGLAILAVIFHHVVAPRLTAGWVSVDVAGIQVPVSAPLLNGWLGVDVFFLLSGFVLFLPYCTGQRTMRGRADAMDYYRRRFFRLMPLYYFNLLVAVALVFHLDPGSLLFWKDALLMGTATFTFTDRLYLPPYNWVLWSLGLEIWFSVLLPLVIRLERPLGMTALVAGALLLSLAVRIAGQAYYPTFRNPVLNPIKDSLAGRLDEFVLGMALARLFVGKGPLTAGRATACCGIGAVAIFIACCLWDWVALGTVPRAGTPYINDVLLLGAFCLTYGLLSLPRGGWKRLVTNAPLQVIGMMCYSLYVWHGVIALRWFPRGAELDVARCATYVAVTFAIGALSYRYIEFGRRDWAGLFRAAAD